MSSKDDAHLIEVLRTRRSEVLATAARHGASNVRVFGSAARGEDSVDSDIDLLVELEAGRGLFDLSRLIADLRQLLDREVDVVTEDGLYWLLRHRILREARPL